MIEFTKKTFQIPRLDRQLDGKDLPDADEIKKFQRQFCKQEIFSREQLLQQERPCMYFAMKAWVILPVLFALFLANICFAKNEAYFLVGLMLLCILVIILLFYRQHVFFNITEVSWDLSPFSAFKAEYKGEIAAQVEPSILSGQGNPLLRLGVEHHPLSDVRFLVVENIGDDFRESIYIDYWEKPEPPRLPSQFSEQGTLGVGPSTTIFD